MVPPAVVKHVAQAKVRLADKSPPPVIGEVVKIVRVLGVRAFNCVWIALVTPSR